MRPLKPFDEFIKEGIVRKQMKDKARSESLKEESEKAYRFLMKIISAIGVEECEPNYIIKNSYDIIMELIRAKMLCDGFNASGDGAHEAEVSYLRVLNFSEGDIQFLNHLRYFRNGILYYGKSFDMDYAKNVLQFLEKISQIFKRSTIKLIIFDLGGIFVENYDLPFFQAVADKSAKSLEEIEEKIKPLMQQSERREISEYTFVKTFLAQLHCHEDPKKVIEIRRQATKENPDIRDFIHGLKKHYKVAFATNNAEEEFAYNNKTFKLKELFDYGIASCEVHARKTEPEIFEKILEHFHVKPEEAVFIDDSEKNLATPKALGIWTIKWSFLEQCKKELKKLEIIF